MNLLINIIHRNILLMVMIHHIHVEITYNFHVLLYNVTTVFALDEMVITTGPLCHTCMKIWNYDHRL